MSSLHAVARPRGLKPWSTTTWAPWPGAAFSCIRFDASLPRSKARQPLPAGHARYSLRNPAFWCEPSQKGLLADSPQRHKATLFPRHATRPLPVTSCTGPSSTSGPCNVGLMCSSASAFAYPGPSSPMAPASLNPSRWLLSQKGLFDDFPQRHRATRWRMPGMSSAACCSASLP